MSARRSAIFHLRLPDMSGRRCERYDRVQNARWQPSITIPAASCCCCNLKAVKRLARTQPVHRHERLGLCPTRDRAAAWGWGRGGQGGGHCGRLCHASLHHLHHATLGRELLAEPDGIAGHSEPQHVLKLLCRHSPEGLPAPQGIAAV